MDDFSIKNRSHYLHYCRCRYFDNSENTVVHLLSHTYLYTDLGMALRVNFDSMIRSEFLLVTLLTPSLLSCKSLVAAKLMIIY